MNERRERDWEDDIDGLAELAELYRETKDVQVPPHLDVHIRAAGREAVRSTRQRLRPRWAVPVSLAAVLVLGVGLVRLLQQEVAVPEQEPAFAPRLEQLPERQAEPIRTEREQTEALRLTPAESPPPPASVTTQGRIGDAVRPVSRASAPPPAATLEENHGLRQRKSLEAASESLIAKDEESDASRSPEAWLEAIAELRRQGYLSEAEAELQAFRRRYPDYPTAPVAEPE